MHHHDGELPELPNRGAHRRDSMIDGSWTDGPDVPAPRDSPTIGTWSPEEALPITVVADIFRRAFASVLMETVRAVSVVRVRGPLLAPRLFLAEPRDLDMWLQIARPRDPEPPHVEDDV
jgi:hypothetical protein